jgi:hypothetical protein
MREFPISLFSRTGIAAAAAAVCALTFASVASAAPQVRSAAGANPAAIVGTVDQFRADLGGALNPNEATTFPTGRREINWDGTPDAFAAPNALPGNFFNTNSPRGVVFTTPGSGFQVSSNQASGVPLRFGNIDPAYTNLFTTFSSPRLFTALGSTQTTVDFFQAGTTTAATTNGFGAVFTDVNLSGPTTIEYFDAAQNSLGRFTVPATGGNAHLSFLGVSFTEGERVAKVTITSGNQVLAPGNTADDLVVMDDFIYGEPRAVPPPPLTLKMSARGTQSPQGLSVKATCSNNCEFDVKAKAKTAGRKFNSKETGDDLAADLTFVEIVRFQKKTLKKIDDVKSKATVTGTATDEFGQTVTQKKKVTLKP